jgi:hypothetical protein
MTIPFNLGKAPDTVVISIQPDNWYDTLLTSVGSDLKIDEIHFLSHPLTTNIFNLKNGNAINTYPNPASSIITLVNPGKTPQTYIATITNSLGKDVMKEEIDFSSANTISVADLSNGVYMLTLKNDKTSYVSKIVIQK